MLHVNRLPKLAGILLFAAFPSLFGQPVGNQQDSIGFWPGSTIFVAEIERANPARGCRQWETPPNAPVNCPTEVLVRAVEILKDDSHQGLAPGEFQATIPSIFGYGSMQPWKTRPEDVKAGQRYLIASLGQKGLVASFSSPRYLKLLDNEDDPVSDIRFIVRVADLPVKEQIPKAITELTQESGHRSLFFAMYLAALLVKGDPDDTAPLAQSLENVPSSVFSTQGRAILLTELATPMGNSRALQRRAYVSLTARYLIDAPEEPGVDAPGIDVAGLLNRVSRILDSDEDRAALRGAISSAQVDQLRTRAADLKKGRKLSVEQSARLDQFVNAINPQ